jgi:hypothetical protein
MTTWRQPPGSPFPQRRLLPCLALSAPKMVRSSPKRAKYLLRALQPVGSGPRVGQGSEMVEEFWMNPDESPIYLGQWPLSCRTIHDDSWWFTKWNFSSEKTLTWDPLEDLELVIKMGWLWDVSQLDVNPGVHLSASRLNFYAPSADSWFLMIPDDSWWFLISPKDLHGVRWCYFFSFCGRIVADRRLTIHFWMPCFQANPFEHGIIYDKLPAAVSVT